MPDYKFIRIRQAELLRLVPDEIFKQIKGVDDEHIFRVKTFADLIVADITQLVYGAFDTAGRIKGLLWASVDVIGSCVCVRMFAMDPEYQVGGLKRAMEFLFEQVKDSKVDKRLECCTARPKAFYNAGWEDSKYKHLVYEVKDELSTDIEITEPDDQDIPQGDDIPD